MSPSESSTLSSPQVSWRLGGLILLSVFAHGAVIGAMALTRWSLDRATPILVQIVVEAPPVEAPAVAPRRVPPPKPKPATPAPPIAPQPIEQKRATTVREEPPPVPVPPIAPSASAEPAPPAPVAQVTQPAPHVEGPTPGGAERGMAPADAKEGGLEAPAAGAPSRLGSSPAPARAPREAAVRGSTGERGGFSPPRPIRQKTPRYPEAARQAGGEGTVLVKAYVQADGTIGAAQVHQSSGDPELDRAALDAIREWRFVPAARDGRVVAAWVLVPVQFKLIR